MLSTLAPGGVVAVVSDAVVASVAVTGAAGAGVRAICFLRVRAWKFLSTSMEDSTDFNGSSSSSMEASTMAVNLLSRNLVKFGGSRWELP